MASEEDFWGAVGALSTALTRSKTVHVNSDEVRDNSRSLAQTWFRDVRPLLLGLGIAPDEIAGIDGATQRLLRLANGRNLRSSYIAAVRALKRLRPQVEARVETLRGDALRTVDHIVAPTSVEAGIVATLERMLPHAALSYRQVLADLNAPQRFSYRGTATELREVVREVLDHLAPDDQVAKSPGFKIEKDRRGPTMKQKARFILKARGLGDSSRAAPENAVELLEDQIATIARSVYERGSASTHAATLRTQVLSFKGYADAILAELLQVHAV